MNGEELRIVYLCVVSLVGTIVLVRTMLALNRSQNRRKEQLSHRLRRMTGAVRTSSPVDDPVSLAKERGIASIDQRFTVTKRLLLPLVIGVTGMLLALPFLPMIPAATISVLVAVISVALSVAGRPVIENAIGGLMISYSRLLHIGDTVLVDGWYGTIEDISITHTTLKIWDWRRYIIPNSQMMQAKLINYSLFDSYQWTYVEFWVSYDADIEKVRELALQAPSRSRYFANHEAPRFWIMETDKEGLRCWVAAWADGPSDAWLLSHDIRTELVRAFHAEGIHTHGYRHAIAQPGASLNGEAGVAPLVEGDGAPQPQPPPPA